MAWHCPWSHKPKPRKLKLNCTPEDLAKEPRINEVGVWGGGSMHKGTPSGDRDCPATESGLRAMGTCAGQILPISEYTIVSSVPALARTSPLKKIQERMTGFTVC